MLTTIARAGLTAAAILLAATTPAPAETLATPASTFVAQQGAPAPADFGAPPSGSFPILFNDHHVYARPDALKQGRVLAALVRGGTILIPLRSMFEQMGATVSYDAATKTAEVSKPGADVKVTVGKPEVIINGESRPLDVAPIWYKGDILVPVRVISEGMGAYVQWLADRQVVVVRYLPPTPPPVPPTAAPASTEAPAQAPRPAPAPKAAPNPFTWSGYVRAYDFYRQNAYGGHAAANQQSENNAVSLSGQYRFEDTGLSVGASYLYANPLSTCSNVASNISPAANSNACYQGKGAPYTNPDNTLPAFQLSTLYQAYLQYQADGFYFKGGDQVINTPWANAGDSRLKPIAFQGVDASYKIDPQWSIEGADFWEWECRTCSDFDHGTLLTALSPVPKLGGGVAFNGYSGANAYPGNYYDPTFTEYTNNGFIYGRVGYAGGKAFPLAANVYYYDFDKLANALWFDAKYPFAATGQYHAFLAAQGGSEANPTNGLLGKIDSTVFGMQAGFNPLKNVLLTGAFDEMPWHTDTVTLPTGFKCASNHTISSPANYAGQVPYFLPAGGTGNCTPGAVAGTANVYYGGWASPYTDTYAVDPLFTASGTQSMPDRRSAGASFKVAATFTSDDKQFFLTLAQTWYDYNNPAFAQSTTGTDVDTQYFFSHMPKSGPYHGLSLRVRLFSRSETYFPGSPAVGLFKYSRFQAEYDF